MIEESVVPAQRIVRTGRGPADDRMRTVTSMSAEEPTYERASILLVDDMEDNLIALEAVLES